MPLTAFIIRPFGKKEVLLPRKETQRVGRKNFGVSQTIDFENVHNKLIKPALSRLNITTHTTDAILQAGNIREDMFHFLMTADLVIADITYHNPNVYYELGIRHAFRDRYTFLIRSEGQDEPFDLKTDRYFTYNHKHPDESVSDLVCAIQATVCSERSDSPVFRLLPRMRTEDRAKFIQVPQDFVEAVQRAMQGRRAADLQLLAAECEDYLWEVEGLRVVGQAQFELNYLRGALTTWERIVSRYPDDIRANIALSTIYHRINDDIRAEQALERIANIETDVNTMAEIRSLVARNYKAKWCSYWYPQLQRLMDARDKDESGIDKFIRKDQDCRDKALRSPFLRKARQEYSLAYFENLNHIQSGVNALCLLLTEWSLAQDFKDTWNSLAESEEQAQTMQNELVSEISRITKSLQFAISVEHNRLERQNKTSFWFEIMEALFLCMTSSDREKVEQNYLEALLWAPESAELSMRPTLLQYQSLNIRHPDTKINIQANLRMALDLIDGSSLYKARGNIFVFVGLKMAPSSNCRRVKQRRTKRTIRFLAPSLVDKAKSAIKEALEIERLKANGSVLFGMAAGSGGSDLLFHEACDDLGIKTRLFLALPRDNYVGKYVAPAGPQWVDRFNEIYRERLRDRVHRPGSLGPRNSKNDIPISVLADCAEMPRWLQNKAGYTPGRRNAIWLLQNALTYRDFLDPDKLNVTLFALWDGKGIDSHGGISDLVDMAEKNGVKVVTIDCTKLRHRKDESHSNVPKHTASNNRVVSKLAEEAGRVAERVDKLADGRQRRLKAQAAEIGAVRQKYSAATGKQSESIESARKGNTRN